MAILGALATALPYVSAAWNIGSQFLNKPKKDDYVPSGGAYTRYIDHLKSQTAESTVYHQAMRPQLRQIGQQANKTRRGAEQFAASKKPGGGVEAQMLLGINQDTLSAMGIAHDKAFGYQQRANVQAGRELTRMSIQEERGLQRYSNAKDQWTKNLFGTAVSQGLGLAQTAINSKLAAGGEGGNAGAEFAKTEAQLDSDWNALDATTKASIGSRKIYGEQVRAQSSSYMTKLDTPDKQNIKDARMEVRRLRKERNKFGKDTQDWARADATLQDAKNTLRNQKYQFGEADKKFKGSNQGYTIDEKTGQRIPGVPQFVGTEEQVSSDYSKWLSGEQERVDEFNADALKDEQLRSSAVNLMNAKEEMRANPGERFNIMSELMTNEEGHALTTKDETALLKYGFDLGEPGQDKSMPYNRELMTGMFNGSADQVRKALIKINTDPNVSDKWYMDAMKMGTTFMNAQAANAEQALTKAQEYQIKQTGLLYNAQLQYRFNDFQYRNEITSPSTDPTTLQDIGEGHFKSFINTVKGSGTSMSAVEAQGALRHYGEYLSTLDTVGLQKDRDAAKAEYNAGKTDIAPEDVNGTNIADFLKLDDDADVNSLTTTGRQLMAAYSTVERYLNSMVKGTPYSGGGLGLDSFIDNSYISE